MASRHQVRQSVISLLYALELNGKNENFVDEFLNEKKIRNEAKNFTLSLYNGVLEHLESLDERIDIFLNENKIHQIGHIERAILRLGAFELLYTDTLAAIVINEAVELAIELANEKAHKLIIGVLDGMQKAEK